LLVDGAILLSHPIFHKNFEFCIETFIKNGYSVEIIFRKINIRLKTFQCVDKKIITNNGITNSDYNVRK